MNIPGVLEEPVEQTAKNETENELVPPNSLENFLHLCISEQEGLESEEAQWLNNVGIEVTGHIRAPATSAARTLSQLSPDHPVRTTYERQYAQALDMLNYFNDFCALDQEHAFGNCESVGLDYAELDEGGYIFSFAPPQGRDDFGKLGVEPVSKIEVVVRNGENEDAAQALYTPMQVNFRFLTKPSKNSRYQEVNSLRIDMHKHKEKDIIQVDSKLSSGDRVEKKHVDVDSINTTENPVLAFRKFQSAFLIGFIDTIEGSSLFDLDSDHALLRKKLDKIRKNEELNLSYKEEIVVSREDEVQNLLNARYPVVTQALTTALQEGESPVTEVLPWLLNIPEDYEGDSLSDDYGDRVDALQMSLQNIDEVPEMQEEMLDDELKGLRDRALEAMIGAEDFDANQLDELQKLISIKKLIEHTFTEE